MIYVKINKTENRDIIAVCDSDLIGKKFSENDLVLDITERFYKGKIMGEKEVIELLENAQNINLVGKDSINLALKSGIIEKENVIYIKKIPHAIIFEI